jgi:hypothetical protein
MEEINWRVIDNRLKDEPRTPHGDLVLQMERSRRREKLYKNICRLEERLPEPTNEEDQVSIGQDAPEDKHPNTAEGLAKWQRHKEMRRKKMNLAFNLNWAVTEPKVI